MGSSRDAGDTAARLFTGAQFGAVVDETSDYTFGPDRYERTASLSLSPSFRLGAEYAWHSLVAGAEVGLGSLGSRRVLDVSVRPSARYRVRGSGLEFHGAVRCGVRVPLEADWDERGLFQASVSSGVQAGVLAGLTYFFTRRLGVRAEVGWSRSWHSWDLERVLYEPDPSDPRTSGEPPSIRPGSVNYTEWLTFGLGAVVSL